MYWLEVRDHYVDPEYDEDWESDFVYLHNCTQSDADSINDLQEGWREITYRTLIQHVYWKELMSVFPDYEWQPGPVQGLRLKNDWAVQYFKGIYRGVPCYVVVHSGIEYIFVLPDDVNDANSRQKGRSAVGF